MFYQWPGSNRSEILIKFLPALAARFGDNQSCLVSAHTPPKSLMAVSECGYGFS
jgi:hypothetical protein